MAGLDQRASCRDVDHERVAPRPDSSARYSMLVGRGMPCCAPAFERRAHSGAHRRLRESYLRMRVFPVSPKIRMAYWALWPPRTYRLPAVAVPMAVKLTMSLAPSRMGSEPGAVLVESTAGRFG